MSRTERKPMRLTDAQRVTVEENIGLVGFVLSKFGSQGVEDPEDAFQIGLIGLMKAAAKYRGAEVRLSTFAISCILNELRRESRLQSRKRRGGGTKPLSLDAFMDGDGKRGRLDALPDPGPGVEAQIERDALRQQVLMALEQQHTRAAQIALEYLTTDATQAELARRYDLRQVTVSRLIKQALGQVREQARRQGDWLQ